MFSFKAIFLCFILFIVTAQATIVSYDGRAITIDGQRRVILSGSIHYPRSTSEMWPDLIKKAKEGGLNAVETYVFWNAHEPLRRQYDFTGNLDLVKFIKAIQAEGLYAVLRIGPYVCAEWNYGGFPVWLHNMPGIELRTLNDVFMNEMQNFTTLIVDMMKQEKLFASQGGPIILSQIENEYGNVMDIYEDAGKAYIDWCANMAQSLDTGVPWIMCQQKDAPQPMINTCNGWYCDDFTPSNPNTPKMWTENWTGWFKSWGGLDPKRTAEDIAFAVARFFQTGGTFQNYYMVTSADLHRQFHSLGAGIIEDVRIQRDKGFGFVRYSSHGEAARAIQLANARILFGKPLKCSWGSKPTPPGTSSSPLPPPAVAMPGFSAADLATYERQVALAKMGAGAQAMMQQQAQRIGAASQAIYDGGYPATQPPMYYQ